MRSRKLGLTGPDLTVLGFGAWAVGGANRFGWSGVRDEDSVAAIRHAVERGVNWVDTAAFYGKGHSEEVVARALDPYRVGDEVLVFTKCGLRWDPDGGRDAPPRNDLSPESIRFECDASLARLGVERIDLFQFHWPDETGVPVEESWGTMAELVDAGKVRWAGVSNFTIELLERCESLRHVDSVQPELSLVAPDRMRDVIPWAAENGSGVIVYSPMASGLLTGAFDRRRADALPADDWRKEAPAFNEPALSSNLELVAGLEKVCAGVGCSLPELAVAWTLTIPGVTGAIVGARSARQVDGWAGAADVRLDNHELDEIDRLLRQRAVAGRDNET